MTASSPRAGAALLVAALSLGISSCSSGQDTDGERLAVLKADGFGAAGPLYPKRPWTVDYKWDCTKQLDEGRSILQTMRLQVVHSDDGAFLEEDAVVEKEGKKGQGTVHYDKPGAYNVSITTPCEFELRVEQEKKS